MYIVDRKEGNYVVCEDENKVMHDFLAEQFPKEIQAGDVVNKEGDRFIIDKKATEDRTQKIKQLMNSLWED